MIAEGTLRGIGFFLQEILHLVSLEKKETIENVIEHFKKKDIIEYISEEYKNEFSFSFDNSNYDNAALNQFFYDYSDYRYQTASRKYGLINHDDGLLLILALITEKIEESSIDWTVKFES